MIPTTIRLLCIMDVENRTSEKTVDRLVRQDMEILDENINENGVGRRKKKREDDKQKVGFKR